MANHRPAYVPVTVGEVHAWFEGLPAKLSLQINFYPVPLSKAMGVASVSLVYAYRTGIQLLVLREAEGFRDTDGLQALPAALRAAVRLRSRYEPEQLPELIKRAHWQADLPYSA